VKTVNDINTAISSDDQQQVDATHVSLALDIMATLGAIAELVRRYMRRDNEQQRALHAQQQQQ
jgi:hypothetical protein